MKTTTLNFDYSNLTDEQLKAVAILQHNDEAYFILDDKIYLGDNGSAMTDYENDSDYKEASFADYCEAELIEADPYDEDDDYNRAYMCLTDSEADDKASESIKNSLWAFNASFIASETGLDEEVIQAIIDNGKCESNNDTMYRLIEKLGSIDSFIEEAICADGRGHFMNSYDGEENEENVNGVIYFIYRMG